MEATPMKKLLSLLAAVVMMCAGLVPAWAETSSVTITYDEFVTGMNALTTAFLDLEMTWQPDSDGFIYGNLFSNPVLVKEGDHVSMAAVFFTLGAEEDAETVSSLFVTVCALVGAVPAVRDGAAPETAPDLVFAELVTMLSSLTAENPNVIGSLYGVPCILSLSEDEQGVVSMSLMLVYTVPAN